MLALFLVPLAVGAQFDPSAPRLFGSGSSADLRLLRRAWIEDVEAGRLLSSLFHYAPDAMLLNPDGSEFEGFAALRRQFTDEFARVASHIRLVSHGFNQSGDPAYDSGSYTEDLTDGATHVRRHLHGRYLTIYHRAGTNPGMCAWQIVQQAWTEGATGTPSPGSPAP